MQLLPARLDELPLTHRLNFPCPQNADFGAKACIQVRSGFLPAKESDTWFPGAYGFPDILYPFPTNCPRTPYKGIGQPNLIPGLTEAEHFDRGGPGIAYSDWDSYNSGGPVAFRPAEGVDLQPDSKDWNDSGDNYYVGGLSPGEFLLYSMQVVESGTYTLEVQVASKVKDPTEIFVLFDADNCGVHGGGYTVADVKASGLLFAELQRPVALTAHHLLSAG